VLFAMIVLGFLGLAANRNQQKASAQLVSSVLGTRADLASRSALQTDISDFYLGSNSSCTAGDRSMTFAGEGLNQCSATVSCAVIGVLDSGVTVYKLTGTGSCQAGGTSYQRVVEVGVKK
jgi:MSHA biogenesis protein MshP